MERVVQLLCEGERSSIDSRVLVANTRARTSREPWRGVPVTRVASIGAIGSVGVCPAFPLELWRSRRDVTVIHEPNPLGIASHWLAAQQGPLVVWFHSEVLRPRWKYRLMYRPFLRRVLGMASRIVVSSPNLAAHAQELRDFRHKCVVIPFGIDVARLQISESIDRRRTEIVRQYPGRRVLFVGRLVEYKGVDVLLDAMRDVDATALVIGDGPLRSTLEARARAEGLGAKVRFLGHVPDDDVVAHMHACDLFVLPSVTRAETFGVVQLEAMACGRPVISTDLPTGVPWVNRHGETGLVVPPGDAPALATALNTLLADETRRRALGHAARARVEEAFTVTRMTEASAALYRQVLAEARGAAVRVEEAVRRLNV